MVAFLFYLLITIGGITDSQLLNLSKGISLPLINITLPIISFSWVAPIIIVGIHLNALLNLLEHSKKLNRWLEKESQIGQLNAIQVKLHPFLFNYTIINENTFFSIISRLLVNICIYFLPLVVLFYFEYRFADLQDLALTSWHFKMFLADFILVLFFYPAILFPNKNRKSRFFSNGLLLFSTYPMAILNASKYVFVKVRSLFTKRKTNVFIRFNILQLIDQFTYWSLFSFSVIYLAIVALLNSKPKVVLAYKNGETIRTIVALYTNQSSYNAYSFLQLKNEKTPIPIPTLDIHGESLILNSPSEEGNVFYKGAAIKLNDRNLVLSRFERCEFTNGDFSKSNMIGAYFSDCKFTSTNFSGATLFHSEFWSCVINNCSFQDANLLNSILVLTKIYHTDFLRSNCKNAIFSASICAEGSSKIIGSNFWGADLRYARFPGIDLIGNSFTWAKLGGADFRGSNLTGSNLCSLDLDSTNFSRANFDGVYLEQRILSKVDLSKRQLEQSFIGSWEKDRSSTQQKSKQFSKIRSRLLHNPDIPFRNVFTSVVYHNLGMGKEASGTNNYELFLYCRKNGLDWRIKEYYGIDEPFKSSFDGFDKWHTLTDTLTSTIHTSVSRQ